MTHGSSRGVGIGRSAGVVATWDSIVSHDRTVPRSGCGAPGRYRHDVTSAPIVVLVSGSGSTLQALLDRMELPDCPFRVVAVGSDRGGAAGLGRAQRAGIPTFVCRAPDFGTRAQWDAALADRVGHYGPELVVCAGFMKILGAAFLERFTTINTHPALLPSFPGAHGVADALAHGVKVTGCTCHVVDAGVDTGPILAQRAVQVRDDDTEESLHARIKVAERQMLVDVVAGLATSSRSRDSTGGGGCR